MSHFSVAVFTNDKSATVDELLAPYDETIKVVPYIQMTRQQAIDYAKKKVKLSSDQEYWEYTAEGYITDKKGNIYSTYNPNAKWDWWEEGGRFNKELRLKNGEKTYKAKIKDIDFSPDPELYKQAIRLWEIVVEKQELKEGEQKPFSWRNAEFFRQTYGTKENYANISSQFCTYAVVDTNGIWYEQAQMGWWGLDNSTSESIIEWGNNWMKDFIEDKDGETMLTIVDCHI